MRTVPEMGWASLENGEPLRLASGNLDVIVTTDQPLGDNQNIAALTLAVVILVAKRNKLEFLSPLVPALRIVLQDIKPGELRRVGV